MPLSSEIAYKFRRWPVLHRPLRWLRRKAYPVILHSGLNVVRWLAAGCRRFGPVTGTYSDLALLRNGGTDVRGRLILEDQGRPIVKPDSPLILAGRREHDQQPFPVFWIRLKGRRLIGPGLAHVNSKKELSLEAVYGRHYLKQDPAYWCCPRGEPLRLEGPWMSLVSRWMPVNFPEAYAHWMLESLPQLAVLKELPAETRIIVPPHKARYRVESLEMLGLSNRCRWTSEQHIEVEDYYFVSPPSMIVCYSPYSVKVARDLLLSKGDTTKATPKRFFVKRTGTGRNMVNEAEVLDFFAKKGWAIVELSELSFAQQITLFANAEAVAAIHGSGMANAVWCRPECKIIELFGDQYIGGVYEWLAQCVGAEYYWLVFPSDHRLNAVVDLGRVRSLLKTAGLSE